MTIGIYFFSELVSNSYQSIAYTRLATSSPFGKLRSECARELLQTYLILYLLTRKAVNGKLDQNHPRVKCSQCSVPEVVTK